MTCQNANFNHFPTRCNLSEGALPRSPGGKQTAGCAGKRHRALCGGPARPHGSAERRGSCGSGGLELSESLGADGLGYLRSWKLEHLEVKVDVKALSKQLAMTQPEPVEVSCLRQLLDCGSFMTLDTFTLIV